MWKVYIIRCANQALYVGMTNDLEKRFRDHESQGARCAKYLRGKGPLTLVDSWSAPTRSAALRLEHRIKKLSKAKKERFANGEISIADLESQDPRG